MGGRRIIYLIVLLCVSAPLIFKFTLKPARLISAEKSFSVVEKLEPKASEVVFIGMDIGPSVKAETVPQLEVIIEHLLRKRVPFATFSLMIDAKKFLDDIPKKVSERLTKEMPENKYEYGKDYVNLGYKPFAQLFFEGLSKSDDIVSVLGKDVFGTPVGNFPMFKGTKTIRQIPLVVEVTGSPALGAYIQFFQRADYRPPILHGATSIMVPEAYIYLDSGQLVGLLEGLSGAAWYSEQLKLKFPNRAPDSALLTNSALGIGQLVVMALIVIGNIIYFSQRRSA